MFGLSVDSTIGEACIPSDSLSFEDSLSNDVGTVFPLLSDSDFTTFSGTNEGTERDDQLAFIGGLEDPSLHASLFSGDSVST